MAPSPRRVWLTPGVFLTILFVAECLLLYLEPIRGFPEYNHRAWPALSTIVFTAGGLTLLGLWFAVAKIFRGRFQFRLRTLVLLFVCIAVPLASLAAELRRVQQMRLVESEIRARGGKLEHSFSVEPFPLFVPFVAVRPARPPEWVTKLLGDDLFYEPTYDILECTGEYFTDDTCRLWREFPGITQLYLRKTRVTEDGLKRLCEFKNLQMLAIEDSPVTDRGLDAVLQSRKLLTLTLINTRITDQGISVLRDQSDLITLTLAGASIRGAGFEHLRKLPQLQLLDVSHTSVDDAGLETIVRLPHLTNLSVCGTSVSDIGLEKLARMKSLRSLDIRGCKISPEAAARFRQAAPRCQLNYDADEAER